MYQLKLTEEELKILKDCIEKMRNDWSGYTGCEVEALHSLYQKSEYAEKVVD